MRKEITYKAYDELGNIMQMKSVGKWTRDYFYNTNDNKLLGHTDGTTEYTYDAHGNITSMPHLTQMNWDYKNQLLGATNGTFSSYYVYDATGNRVRKVVEKGNIIEERFYVGDYEVYRKTTNGTLDVERTTVHISDDQKRIAMIDNDGTTETIRYQYDNHLGSASLELDQNSEIISYEEYHPFGTTSYRSGRSETETSLKRYKYVGKERDEETGLYNYGFRLYAAWLGRFISTDPMAGERSWVNPYNYCQNNPINRTDPTGALDRPDWYESESGAVRHVDSTEKELTIDGEKYKNIGITHTAKIAGDNKHVHYYQDKPFAITDNIVTTSKLLAKHDGMYKKVMGMATERDKEAIYWNRFTDHRSDASGKALVGTFALPGAIIGGIELTIAAIPFVEAAVPVVETAAANTPRLVGQAYVNANKVANAIKGSKVAQVGGKVLNAAEYYAGKFMNETWAGKLITSALASEVDPGAVSNTNVYTDLATNLYKSIKEIPVGKLDDTAILNSIYKHPAIKNPNYSQTK